MVAPTVARPIVGVFSLTGCGGNRLTLLGLEDELAGVVDLRQDDLDIHADIALVDGAVAGRQDEEKLRAIRKRSARLVALGTCAVHGGVAGMESATHGTAPARPIGEVVPVDGTITGCPAEPAEVLASLAYLLRGNPPLPRLYPVCTECKIRETRCVLLHGDSICLGPVTAAGCGARCPAFGIGCFGCRGPAEDANWSSALDLFTERGSDPEDVVLKMRTFARAPVGRPRLHRVDAGDPGDPAGSGDPGERVGQGERGTPRRFERRIVGRGWEDVPGIVSRICAGCAVGHSQTAVRVIERAFGAAPAAQTEGLRDLLWRGQSIAWHARSLQWLAREVAQDSRAADAAHALRELGSALKTAIGGHAVHPVNAIPGGFGRVPEERTLERLRRHLDGTRHDVDALIDMARALPAGRTLEAAPVHLALRQDERYRYDRGDQVILLSTDERRAVAMEALPKVVAEYLTPDGEALIVGPLARLAINRDRVGPFGSELLAVLDVDPAAPDGMTHHRARAIELAMDVRRAMETLECLLATGLTAEPAAAIVPRAELAGTATEAPAGLLLYRVAFDPLGRVRTATILTPGRG